MPAVLIRLIDSLGSIMLDTTSAEQRAVLRRQADMVLRLSEETVAEPNDLEEIRFRYRRLPPRRLRGEALTWSKIDLRLIRPALSVVGRPRLSRRCRWGRWWSRRAWSSS